MPAKRLVVAAVLVFTHAALAGTQAPAPTPAQGHPAPDHMERHFDNAAEWAKEFDDPSRDAWQMPARVIDALGLKRGQSVADIGAGTG
jgi:hypothetical protein